MSNYTKWTVDTLLPSLGATVSISGNTETDPGFAANVASHIDSLIAYIDTIAATGFGPGHRWAYPNNTLYPPTWPLPENLAYSNTSLQHAGTDGFALGDLNWFPTQKAQWLLTAVQKPITGAVPNEYRLYDAYPNPFNPTTNIRFSVPVSGSVSLKVYNIIGQEVTTLVNERKSAGTYEVQFDGNNLSSGVYFYRLTAGNYVETKKLVLMK
ncbi:MAG: T9SS type A sorting domain-containing protein [Bacteroidota bacterium]|nr:T9SS type A sorting domain-containing protein [Bacteroidota bacterium]